MPYFIIFLLSFIAGFVDTATFVGARGVFSAHVTGNFVLFAVALTRGIHDLDYLKIFLFIPFVASLAITAILSRTKFLNKIFEPFMLIVASLLLFFSAAYFYGTVNLKDELWDVSNLIIMLPVLAMGVQSAVYKIHTPTNPMTTVMTGNVIQIVIECIGYKGEVGERHTHIKKAYTILKLTAGFALGCLAGAFLVTHYSIAALALPATLLAGLAVYKFKTGASHVL